MKTAISSLVLALAIGLVVAPAVSFASGTFSVSQTTVSLSVGQTVTINAFPSNGEIANVSSITNNSIVQAVAEGSNEFNLTGENFGSTQVTLCTFDNSCATIQVSVGASNNGFNNNNNNSSSVGVSQSNLSLVSGQTQEVFTFSSNSSVMHVQSNSNSSVASASMIDNNDVNITALNSGFTTISVCDNFNNCANISVSVNGGSNFSSGSISFSQSSVSLNLNQSTSVSIFNNNQFGNNFFISSNSNSSVVSASISGSTLNLFGLNTGSSTISVCNSGNSCGTVFATVNRNGFVGGLTLSPSSVSLNVNQSSTVTIFNGTAFSNNFLSSNSNSSVVSASVSGSQLNLFGLNVGSSTISVCSNGNSCGSIVVTVGGSTNNGSISFSQNNLSMNLNQSQSVSIFNNNQFGGSFFVSSNTNPTAVSAGISGSTLNLFAGNTGSTTITVCNSNNNCGTLFITVNGNSGINSGSISFSQSSVSLSVSQVTDVTIFGSNFSTNSFFISSNSNPGVVNATVSGANTLVLSGNSSGSSTVTVCQSGGGCGSVFVTVSGFGSQNSGTLIFNQNGVQNLVVNQFYSTQLSVSGGNAPYNFSVVSGFLPSGLNLNPNGVISGIPTSTSAASVVIQAQDEFGRTGTVTMTFSPTLSGGGSVLGAVFYANGTLVNDNGTVYLIYKNTKSGFTSFSALTGLGFNPANIIVGPTASLQNSGFVINTAAAAHPWGSWVKNGATIYFVDANGLIPVPDWNTFINNGGNPALVVNVNNFDFGKPLESIMTLNDSRLH